MNTCAKQATLTFQQETDHDHIGNWLLLSKFSFPLLWICVHLKKLLVHNKFAFFMKRLFAICLIVCKNRRITNRSDHYQVSNKGLK